MLHTSPKTLSVLETFNKWSKDLLKEYEDYVNTINEFILAKDSPPTRHTGKGEGRHLDLWHLEPKNRKFYIEHFSSAQKIIEELNQDPEIEVTSVYIATMDGKGKIDIHTDDDSEFIVVKNPEAKMYKKRVRQYRAHIPLIIPEKCFFYHLENSLKKVKWTFEQSFAFEKWDKHYVINESDLPYRVVGFCDFWKQA